MSNIEWTEVTWNPTVGCKEVSPGCRDCYAAKMAWRIIHMDNKAGKDYAGTVKKLPNGKIVWTGQVNILTDRLLEPANNKKTTTYFVDSMSDLFHADIPFSFIDKVFAVMLLCPQHIFQVLTKRTDRMLEYCLSRQDMDYIDEAAEIIVCENPGLFYVKEKISKEGREATGMNHIITNELLPHLKEAKWYSGTSYVDFGDGDYGKEPEFLYEGDWPAKHIWLGTSIEDQKAANERGKPLFDIHNLGWITWVSNEPAIGPVDWEAPFFFGFLDWMVTGGESGSTARPMHPDWPRQARDFCAKNKIPFFFKQWGVWAPANDHADGKSYDAKGAYSDGTIGNAIGAPNVLARVGKHNAGRLLNGKLHDEYPVIHNSQITK